MCSKSDDPALFERQAMRNKDYPEHLYAESVILTVIKLPDHIRRRPIGCHQSTRFQSPARRFTRWGTKQNGDTDPISKPGTEVHAMGNKTEWRYEIMHVDQPVATISSDGLCRIKAPSFLPYNLTSIWKMMMIFLYASITSVISTTGVPPVS